MMTDKLADLTNRQNITWPDQALRALTSIQQHIMFQFLQSFRSERKPGTAQLPLSHNPIQTDPSSYQTAVKNNPRLSLQKFHYPSTTNDKMNQVQNHQNSHEVTLKRQFLTVTSEIRLEGHKYKILKVCTDGQFIGNFMNEANQILSQNCHFAVIQKVCSGSQKHQNEQETVCQGKIGQKSNQPKSHNPIIEIPFENQNLECIVFKLRFEKGSQSPVRILHKGPFMSLYEFYLTKCQKQQAETQHKQTDEVRKLADSIEKWFDHSECTLKLVKTRQNNDQGLDMLKLDENQWQTDYSCKYRFKKYEDFFSINFFIHERFKELAQIKMSNRKRNFINESKNQEIQLRSDKMNEEKKSFSKESTLHKQKLNEELTFSNEKTIPQKLNQQQKPSIFNSELNNGHEQGYQFHQDQGPILTTQKQNSPMIEERSEQVHEQEINVSKDFQEEIKLYKNPQFENTTANKFQSVNADSFASVQIQSHKMEEDSIIVPKKLTFQVCMNQNSSQNQFSERYSSQIDNYKIDEEMKEEAGGYESDDQSQEKQSNEVANNQQSQISYEPESRHSIIEPMSHQQEIHSQSNESSQQNLMQLDSKDLDNKNLQSKELHEQFVPQTFHSFSKAPMTQKQPEEKYQLLHQAVRTQPLVKPDLHVSLEENFSIELLTLENTEFNKSTYSLIRSSDSSVLCLLILKQQGKIYKSSNQPKSKENLIKLILYNPLLLENTQNSCSNSHNKFFNIKSFKEALHQVNAFQVSSNQQRLLLYSTKDSSHPVVLQYNINTERFTSMFKIPQLCYKSGLTQKPLPLIKVQYIKNSTDSFCAMTAKQICIFSRNAHKFSIKDSKHFYHQVFVYRNLFGEKKLFECEFNNFELHENGRHLIAGLNGRYIRVFDLQKQQQDYLSQKESDDNAWKGKQNDRQFLNARNQRKRISRFAITKNIQEMHTKTKKIRRQHNTKCEKLKAHNYDKYKTYYLKALNSFDLDDEQNISPFSSQQRISSINQESEQKFNNTIQKIKAIKLIYGDKSTNQNESNQKQKEEREVVKIYCEREDRRKYLINCVEENSRMGKVSCFEHKLRLNNRSLIREVTDEEAMTILNVC